MQFGGGIAWVGFEFAQVDAVTMSLEEAGLRRELLRVAVAPRLLNVVAVPGIAFAESSKRDRLELRLVIQGQFARLVLPAFCQFLKWAHHVLVKDSFALRLRNGRVFLPS